jgi:hypothetical protein
MTGAAMHNTKSDSRESLLSILKDVSPNVDNYFITNLTTGPSATNTVHAWPVYNTARPTSVTNSAEGASFSYSDLSAPLQSINFTAIAHEPIKVSGTRMAVSTITGENEMAFQKTEALKWLTINGALTSGSSGVASGMAGIDRCISTNVTARSSGTSFTLTEVDDMLNDSYNQVSSQYIADLLVCPMVIKRRISSYGPTNTRIIDATSKKLDGEIRVYDSPVGQSVMILPHKDVRSTAGTLTVYTLREELFQHSYLAGREPFYKQGSGGGDFEDGAYVTEFTIVSNAQGASVKRTGYNSGL